MTAQGERVPLKAHGVTDSGQRPRNDDVVVVDSEQGFFALADGTGGLPGADVASKMASEIVRKELHRAIEQIPEDASDNAARHEVIEDVAQAFQTASAAVFGAGCSAPGLKGMNASLICFQSLGDGVGVVGHVGSCHSYVVDKHEIFELTRPHTYAHELKRMGLEMTAEQERANYHLMLSRGVGTSPGVQVDTVPVELTVNQRLLLCSQNVVEIVPEDEIQAICSKNDVATAAQGLIAAALKREVVGNVSAIVVANEKGRSSTSFVTMDVRVHLLGHCFMFKELDFQDIALLMSIVDVVSFRDGDLVFREGDPGEEFFIVVRGEVSVRKGPTELARMGPGSPVGELSLVLDPIRSATATAIGACSMLRISRDNFEMLRRTRPVLASHLMYSLLKHVGERVRDLSERYFY